MKSKETKDTGLYLIPISDYWREKFRNTVENPLDLTQYDNIPNQLEGYEELRIWATRETEGAPKQAALDQMQGGDCILFYYEGEFFAGGIVERTIESPDIGELIWNQPESCHIYILDEFKTDVPTITQIWKWLDYDGREVVRGFSRVADYRLLKMKQKFGSVESAIFGDENQ